MAISMEAQNAAESIQRELQSRDVQGLGAIALSTAGGAILAQEVSERVLAALGRPTDPSSPANIGVSALSKVGTALAVGVATAQMGGLGLLIGAFVGVGALVSAGVDLFDVLQRGGIPGNAPQGASAIQGGGSGNRTPAAAQA